MRVTYAAFWTHKGGNRSDEYEDAYAIAPAPSDERSAIWRFAVADGATDGYRSGPWANRLVQAAVNDQLRLHLLDTATLARVQRPFAAGFAVQSLPWYAEEKARRGAFAALAVLELHPLTNWRATAVGDCCLFHVRAERLATAFPLRQSSDFNSSPFLIGSNAPPTEVRGQVKRTNDTAEPGDEFYLASDALAQWFLAEVEAERRPWEELRAFGDPTPDAQAAFADRVRELRAAKAIRNDDTTFLRVTVSGEETRRHAVAHPPGLPAGDAGPGGGVPGSGAEDRPPG